MAKKRPDRTTHPKNRCMFPDLAQGGTCVVLALVVVLAVE